MKLKWTKDKNDYLVSLASISFGEIEYNLQINSDEDYELEYSFSLTVIIDNYTGCINPNRGPGDFETSHDAKIAAEKYLRKLLEKDYKNLKKFMNA